MSSFLELEKFLIEEPCMYSVFFEIVKSGDAHEIGTSLVHIFFHHGRHTVIRTAALHLGVMKRGPVAGNVFLRGINLASSVLSEYARLCGMEYLRHTLSPTLKKILKKKKSYEIDARRVMDKRILVENRTNLSFACDKLFTAITRSIKNVPVALKEMFMSLARVMAKYQIDGIHNKKSAQKSAILIVGRFAFLRFFCPAIVSPLHYGLFKSKDVLTTDVRKTLIQISKVLLKVANREDENLGPDEPLHFLNSFIEMRFEQMKEFAEQLLAEDGPCDRKSSVPKIKREQKHGENLYKYLMVHHKEVEGYLVEHVGYPTALKYNGVIKPLAKQRKDKWPEEKDETLNIIKIMNNNNNNGKGNITDRHTPSRKNKVMRRSRSFRRASRNYHKDDVLVSFKRSGSIPTKAKDIAKKKKKKKKKKKIQQQQKQKQQKEKEKEITKKKKVQNSSSMRALMRYFEDQIGNLESSCSCDSFLETTEEEKEKEKEEEEEEEEGKENKEENDKEENDKEENDKEEDIFLQIHKKMVQEKESIEGKVKHPKHIYPLDIPVPLYDAPMPPIQVNTLSPPPSPTDNNNNNNNNDDDNKKKKKTNNNNTKTLKKSPRSNKKKNKNLRINKKSPKISDKITIIDKTSLKTNKSSKTKRTSKKASTPRSRTSTPRLKSPKSNQKDMKDADKIKHKDKDVDKIKHKQKDMKDIDKIRYKTQQKDKDKNKNKYNNYKDITYVSHIHGSCSSRNRASSLSSSLPDILPNIPNILTPRRQGRSSSNTNVYNTTSIDDNNNSDNDGDDSEEHLFSTPNSAPATLTWCSTPSSLDSAVSDILLSLES